MFRVTANLRDADTKEALLGALIEVTGHPGRYVTGMHGQGWVEFPDLSGPVAEVTARSFGYETRTEAISLQEGRTTVVEVSLAIDAVVLAPLEVEARSRFLDGRPVGLAGLNMNDLQPEELEFAEVYDPGRVPGRYLPVADYREPPHVCGIVLLWSRKRAQGR